MGEIALFSFPPCHVPWAMLPGLRELSLYVDIGCAARGILYLRPDDSLPFHTIRGGCTVSVPILFLHLRALFHQFFRWLLSFIGLFGSGLIPWPCIGLGGGGGMTSVSSSLPSFLDFPVGYGDLSVFLWSQTDSCTVGYCRAQVAFCIPFVFILTSPQGMCPQVFPSFVLIFGR